MTTVGNYGNNDQESPYCYVSTMVASIDDPLGIYVVTLLRSNEPRMQKKDFFAAQRKAVDGLLKRKVWSYIKRSKIPDEADEVESRYTSLLNNIGNPDDSTKVGYVARGYNDLNRSILFYDASFLRSTYIRCIKSTASIIEIHLTVHDVSQAYVQSDEPLFEDIHKPQNGGSELIVVGHDENVQPQKYLYGVCVADDYWNKTMESHIKEELRMEPSVSGPSRYLNFIESRLCRILVVNVDDILIVTHNNFETATKRTFTSVRIRPRKHDSFSFLDEQVKCIDHETVSLSQPHYCVSLKIIPLNTAM